eukprot:TRINITY_DN4849_c0_g1_i1.p1 TRINITY_DN4849_c0_g1~~TRINITY_DN4849_c0_g1_i1.p1  ORF type:complete len:357 (-),score=58.69 TRINITY_DN4849_c0_g1_i1:69-1139(-)
MNQSKGKSSTSRELRAREASLPFDEGYPESIFEDPSLVSEYKCPICLSVLRDPVEDNCSPPHTFCETCIKKVIRQRCPLNPSGLIGDTKLSQTKQSYLGRLRTCCFYQSEGCPFNDDLSKLGAHLIRECEYRRVLCSNVKCTDTVAFRDMTKHTEACQFVHVECPFLFCSKRMEKRALEEHKARCEFRVENCSLGCGSKMTFKKMEEHIEKECPNKRISCPFAEVARTITANPTPENENLLVVAETVKKLCGPTERGKMGIHLSRSLETHVAFELALMDASSKEYKKALEKKLSQHDFVEERDRLLQRISELELKLQEEQQRQLKDQTEINLELKNHIIQLETQMKDNAKCRCEIF